MHAIVDVSRMRIEKKYDNRAPDVMRRSRQRLNSVEDKTAKQVVTSFRDLKHRQEELHTQSDQQHRREAGSRHARDGS